MDERKSKPSIITAAAAASSISVEVTVEDPTPPPPPNQQLPTVGSQCLHVSTFMLLTVIIIYLIWLLVLPQRPNFGLNSLSISRFNIPASEITSNWNVVMVATNPHPLIYFAYDHAVLSVFHKNQCVSEEGVFPKIFLPVTKRTQSYTAKTVALAKRIEDSQAADALARDLSEGDVSFNVRLLQSSMFHTDLNVTCADIMVGFKANHEGPYDCTLLLAPTDQHQAYARCSSYAVFTSDI